MSSPISISQSIANLKAAASVPDKRQAEQAFAEQVYSLVVNRAAPLMTEQRRLGFEIVHSNDDSTFMVGIWVSRLSQSDPRKLVYIVCFFQGGKVSVDSLYDVSRKQFRPLTQEWCKQIIDNNVKQEGEPVDRALTAKFRPNIRFNRIILGGESKRASVRSDADFVKDLEEMCTLYEPPARILPHLAKRVGGEKLANVMLATADNHLEFATRLSKLADVWVKDVFSVDAEPVKAASTDEPDVPLLTLLNSSTIQALDTIPGEKQAEVRRAVASKGFWLEGGRDPDAGPDSDYYSDIYDPTQGRMEFVNVSEAGIYDLLMSDGKTEKCLVGHPVTGFWDLCAKDKSPLQVDQSLAENRQRWGSNADSPTHHHHLAVNLKDKSFYDGRGGLWAIAGGGGKPEELQGLEDMTKGKVYSLYLPSKGYLTTPVQLTDKQEQDGGIMLTLDDCHKLFISPSVHADYGYGCVSKHWRAVEVENLAKDSDDNCNAPCGPCGVSMHIKTFVPGGESTIREVIEFENIELKDIKKASLRCFQEVGDWFELQVDGRTSSRGTEADTMFKLATFLGVHPEAAREVVKRASDDGQFDFILRAPEKLASAMLSIIDTPYWQMTYDSTIMANVQEDQAFVLRTRRQPVFTPAGRIGDHFVSRGRPRNARDVDPDTLLAAPSRNKKAAAPDALLAQGSPDQLAQFSAAEDDNVFDHGVVASMTQISDLAVYLDEYVPNLESSLDYLGRCLFTYRVAPQEWSRLFGKDDMKEAEDRLVTTYRTMGECVLFLLQRSDVPNT